MDEATFQAKCEKATREGEQIMSQGLYATRAAVEADQSGEDFLFIHYANGSVFAFPARLIQGVADMTPEQRRKVEVCGTGEGLRWEDEDWDIFIPSLLQGHFGSEKWMQREVARLNGQKKSAAKAASSRANGKKGGRPKKQPTASG